MTAGVEGDRIAVTFRRPRRSGEHRCEARNRLVSPSPEQVVGHAARAGHDLEVELVKQIIG